MDAAHRQRAYPVRLDWGPSGAAALTPADLAVVVDVLSFTTTLTVAIDRDIEVVPLPWHDVRAARVAEEYDAVLAVGRQDSTPGDGRVTLSPAAMQAVAGIRRVVLPSPNGSTVATSLAAEGSVVVGASLRNRAAVARWLLPRLREGATVAVVAAGERWPDGTLRPAVEDLWGAGALLAALTDAGVGEMSPEAGAAVAAFGVVEDDPLSALRACASGRELGAKGYAADVVMAASLDVSGGVPVLEAGVFRRAAR